MTAPTPDTPAPLNAGEREEERLAKVLQTFGVPEPGEVLARRVITSDWLAQYVARAAVVAVVHGSQQPDMETRARIYNEGYEDAIAQHLADDPGTASDWLAAHDAALLAERDALAERVERVKALADEWGALGDTDVAWWWSSLADRLRAALDVSPEPDETGGGR